jgi:hypothetical protein
MIGTAAGLWDPMGLGVGLPQGWSMNIAHTAVAKVREARPDTASVQGDTTMTIDLHDVGSIKVHTESMVTQTGLSLIGRVTMDDKLIFEKRWTR